MDYVRKERRWEMKEEKIHRRSQRKKCSELKRQEKRAEGKKDGRQAVSASGVRGSLITRTQHLQ
jgi:hypothetical protein